MYPTYFTKSMLKFKSSLNFTVCILVFTFIFSTNLKAQTALNFDGVDDYVDLGNSPSLTNPNFFTVEAHIRQTTVQNYPSYVSRFEDSLSFWKGYWLGGDNTGLASFYLGEISTTFTGFWLFSTTNIADGNFHHLAGVVENDSAKLYVDGVLEATLYVPNVSLSYQGVWLGNDVLNDIFTGDIEDVRIWSVSRTPSEILDYKDSCLAGDEAGLEAYYHFEDGTNSTIVTDLTFNGSDGTLMNMDASTAWVTGINCNVCNFTNPDSTSTTLNICSGSNYTFPDGSSQNNIISQVIQYSNLFGTNTCDSVVTTTLNINTVNTTVSQSATVLTAAATSATFQWVDCNNAFAILPGETSSTFTATINGSYAVVVTQNSCSDTSVCFNVGSIGISNSNINKNIIAYPNPTTGNLTINLGEIFEYVDIEITNVMGQVISTKKLENTQSSTIHIEGEAGIYFIKVKTGDQFYSNLRIIKE